MSRLADHINAYDYTWLLSDSRWAWEFLRRNPEFLEDSSLPSASELSFAPACHQITLVRPRGSQALAERWGLAFFPDPDDSGFEADAFWSGGLYPRRVHMQVSPSGPNESCEFYDRTVGICRITHFTDLAGREQFLLKGNGCVIQVFCTGMSLLAREPVKLSFIIDSLDEFQVKLKTLQRAQRVYDPQAEADIPEWTRHSLALRNALVALDCHDAELSYYETAVFIYGAGRALEAWGSPSRAMKDEMKRALARGIESMSNIEYYTTDMRWGARSGTTRLYDRLDRGRERSQPEERFGYISGMIETAENLARDYQIGREDADAYAARSHQRAAAAWDEGKFDAETVSVEVPQRKGAPVVLERDEGIRPDSTVESLNRLRALLKDGTVTAGNAAQQNDAAAACLIVSEDKLDEYGLKPMAFLKGWSAVGCEPSHMGIGPVSATRKVLQKTGLSMQDMGLVEINEAFATQVLACLKGLDWDDQSILNVNGSGISLGHPIGATGVRIMTTLLHEMARRDVRYGLETMCVGGGQGMAAVFERA